MKCGVESAVGIVAADRNPVCLDGGCSKAAVVKYANPADQHLPVRVQGHRPRNPRRIVRDDPGKSGINLTGGGQSDHRRIARARVEIHEPRRQNIGRGGHGERSNRRRACGRQPGRRCRTQERRNEFRVQGAVRIEPGQQTAWLAVEVRKCSTDQHPSVALEHQSANEENPVRAGRSCPRVEGCVQRPVGVQARDPRAGNTAHGCEVAGYEQFPIGLDRQSRHVCVRPGTGIEGEVHFAVRQQPRQPVARHAVDAGEITRQINAAGG